MTCSFTASAWQSCLADFLPYLPDEPPRTAKVFNAPIAPGLFREFVQFSAEPGRRRPGSGEVRVCHGCPLSIAWTILRNGFKVGAGRHQGRSGVFLMSLTSILRMEAFQLARDRSTSSRCLEWVVFGPGSVWSMPVVLSFVVSQDSLTNLGPVGHCQKVCIRAEEGVTMKIRSSRVSLTLQTNDIFPWHFLHTNFATLQPLLDDGIMVLCHGRLCEPWYWSEVSNNESPSCGRACAYARITRAGWRWSRNVRPARRIFYCPDYALLDAIAALARPAAFHHPCIASNRLVPWHGPPFPNFSFEPFVHAQFCLKGCPDGGVDSGVRARADNFTTCAYEKKHPTKQSWRQGCTPRSPMHPTESNATRYLPRRDMNET